MSVETTTNNWYRELVSRVNTLSETFGLDDLQTSDLRNFVVTIARDQYKIGNKMGAAWAFKQPRERRINNQPAQATA